MHRHTFIEELPTNVDPEFGKQFVHVALDVAAIAPLYLLAPQSVQAAGPVKSLNFPATHPVHAPPRPLFPVYPALHAQAEAPLADPDSAGHTTHAVRPVAPEYVPLPQSLHAAEPCPLFCFPATHAVHVPPSGPLCPALHVQLRSAVLLTGEIDWSGQILHKKSPVLVLYLPASQSTHFSVPTTVLYVP